MNEDGTPEQGAADAAPPASGAGPSGRRRRHRRVVALSEVDRQRLAAGELTNEVEALHQGDAPAARPSPSSEQSAGENDARLLRDVPPHWGKR
jgi:hypothetical protein